MRPLTTTERSYIQTFLKGFIFEGSKTDKEQMIGNAVPVKLAEFVARAILDYIADNKKVKQTKLDTCLPNTAPKKTVAC